MANSTVQVRKCDKCLIYYSNKTVHDCLFSAVEEPSSKVKIINSEESQKKISVFDDISDSENNDHEYHTTSKFISAIEVRRPLYDHRLQLTKRTEAIKSKLWNEIYVELKGQFTIDELKKKWRYLREKFVRERQKPKSGSKGGLKKNWVHFSELAFMEDIVTHDKKTTSNLHLDLDSFESGYSENSKVFETRKRKSNNNEDFQRELIQELKSSRPVPVDVVDEQDDPDVNFGKYLISLMKALPNNKKKRKLQNNIISSVIAAEDSE